MSKGKEVICGECGKISAEHRHFLNKGTTELTIICHRAGRPVRARDTGMDYSQRANGIKAQYFGLIEPYITPDNQRVRGWWRITAKGKLFCEGQIKIKKTAVTRDNFVTRLEGKEINIEDCQPGYRVRGDYADDVRQQILGMDLEPEDDEEDDDAS